MLEVYLPILGVLFGAGLALATALVVGARFGPHRLWSLALFIACIALVAGSRLFEYGIPIVFDDTPGFMLALTAVARATLATAVTIQWLRSTRATTPWQVGAGTVAGEATMLTGVQFIDGC